jgi:hypothetical protein
MTQETSIEVKERIIKAGHKAVNELIKIAEEEIIVRGEDELAADKLKNAAMSKKLAIFDAFEILNRIESEKENIEISKKGESKTTTKGGFAEANARK